MRYAFTGPARLSDADRAQARSAVAALSDGTEFTTGACSGWDVTCAALALELWPAARHRIVCPADSYDEAGVVTLARLASHYAAEAFTVIRLARLDPAADPYRARNEVLVSHGDLLVAGVRSPRFYRSGEWMTVNIAHRAAVPVRLIELPKGGS